MALALLVLFPLLMIGTVLSIGLTAGDEKFAWDGSHGRKAEDFQIAA